MRRRPLTPALIEAPDPVGRHRKDGLLLPRRGSRELQHLRRSGRSHISTAPSPSARRGGGRCSCSKEPELRITVPCRGAGVRQARHFHHGHPSPDPFASEGVDGPVLEHLNEAVRLASSRMPIAGPGSTCRRQRHTDRTERLACPFRAGSTSTLGSFHGEGRSRLQCEVLTPGE